MKTELKYLLFWLLLLSTTVVYMILMLLKFSSSSIQHLVETCVTGISSALHLGNDVLPVVVFPLVGLGLFAILLKVCLSLIKTQRRFTKVADTRLQRIPKKIRSVLLRAEIDTDNLIVVKSSQPLAYTIGFFSSSIVVSSSLIDLLSARELEAVLIHERYHQRHLHTFLFFIAEITRSALFLMPIMKEVFIRMKLKLEVDADKSVLKYQQTHQHLLTALEKVTCQPNIGYFPGIATYGLTDRIQVLTTTTVRAHTFSVHSVIVSFCMGMVGITLLMMPRVPEVYASSQIETQSCALRTKTFTQNMSSFTQRFSPLNY